MKRGHNEDSISRVIRLGVIHDDNGHNRIRQCHPKIHAKHPISQHVIAANDRTVGDILNKLKFNTLLRSIVIQKS